MTCVMRILGTADGSITFDRAWLGDYDMLDGKIQVTSDKAKAKQFADGGKTMDLWTHIPIRRPIRNGPAGDGRPNRPLTAFTVQVEPCD